MYDHRWNYILTTKFQFKKQAEKFMSSECGLETYTCQTYSFFSFSCSNGSKETISYYRITHPKNFI